MDAKRAPEDEPAHAVKRVAWPLLPSLYYRYTPIKGIGDCYEIFFSKKGNLLAADFFNNAVIEYAGNSFFSRSRRIAEGMHKAPVSCVVDGTGRFFVSEFGSNCVRFFSDDGTQKLEIGVLGPQGLALSAEDDLLYVCSVPRYCWPKDKTPGAVKIFSALDGSAIKEITNGPKFKPVSVGILSTGQVAVSCHSAPMGICIFNEDSSIAFSFGQEYLSMPCQLAIGVRDVIYVTDIEKHHVAVFLADGTLLARIGHKGTGDGQFRRPFGVAIHNKSAALMVSDNAGRIQIFG